VGTINQQHTKDYANALADWLNRIQRLIEANQPDLMEKWDEFFRD
jgi:hypothetical protein